MPRLDPVLWTRAGKCATVCRDVTSASPEEDDVTVVATSEPISAEAKAEARAEAKRQAERRRRATILAAAEACKAAGVYDETASVEGKKVFVFPLGTPPAPGNGVELSPDQRERAATYRAGHAGLTGQSLAIYILEGKTLNEQVAAARAAEARPARGERQGRTPKDPEGTALAAKAKALAPDLKSKFRGYEGREILDLFKIEDAGDGAIRITRTDRDGDDSTVLPRESIEAFSIGGAKDPVVRKAFVDLGSGTRLWGRKLGLFILVRFAEVTA